MPLKIFPFLIAVLITFAAIARQQAAVTHQVRKDSVYTFVEEPPIFPGGDIGLSKYLIKNMRFSEKALEDGIFSARVQFVIDTLGCVRDVTPLATGRGTMEAEVIRAVKMMPAWKPARHQGRKVKVLFYLPVSCMLPQE